jgi:LPXTG-site transpeptidase (sortase) family protein
MKLPIALNFQHKKNPGTLSFKLTLKYNPAFLTTLAAGTLGAMLMVFAPQAYNYVDATYFSPTAQVSQQTQQEVDTGKPTQITFHRFELTMDVKEAIVTENDWQIHDDAVSYLKNSGTINGGNIILYAHNEKSEFGRIIELGTQDIITLKTKTGERKYQVTQAFEGTPQDLWPLQTQEDQLTMYTCSGLFDSKRFFVIAKPISSE